MRWVGKSPTDCARMHIHPNLIALPECNMMWINTSRYAGVGGVRHDENCLLDCGEEFTIGGVDDLSLNSFILSGLPHQSLGSAWTRIAVSFS